MRVSGRVMCSRIVWGSARELAQAGLELVGHASVRTTPHSARLATFVERGTPGTASAFAPTRRKSTCSAINADNMSRKSMFNDRFPHEGPGVKRQRPHHLELLRRRCRCFVSIGPDGRRMQGYDT